MPFKPRRYRLKKKAPMTKRKFGGTRTYKKKIANKITVIKRLSAPIRIGTLADGSAGVISDDGNQFTLTPSSGAPNSGSIAGTAQLGGSFAFQLQSCIQHTDLTNLFDRYRISGIKLDFLYQQNTSDTAGGSCLPVMWSAYDFDDDTPPVNVLTLQVKGYCRQRVLNANRNFSVYIKPRVLKAVQLTAGAGDVAASSDRSGWFNSVNDDVQHLGFKLWLDNWMGSTAEAPKCMLTIQPTYYLQLKDTQ